MTLSDVARRLKHMVLTVTSDPMDQKLVGAEMEAARAIAIRASEEYQATAAGIAKTAVSLYLWVLAANITLNAGGIVTAYQLKGILNPSQLVAAGSSFFIGCVVTIVCAQAAVLILIDFATLYASRANWAAEMYHDMPEDMRATLHARTEGQIRLRRTMLTLSGSGIIFFALGGILLLKAVATSDPVALQSSGRAEIAGKP
jgi:hypothetical protein